MTQHTNTEGAKCELRRANGIEGVPCDERRCTYWKLIEHIDYGEQSAIAELPAEGCAIQHFELLGEKGAEIAEWLWSVKCRVEGLEGDGR